MTVGTRPRPSAAKTYLALVRALWLSWIRDRSQVFFNILLPLMFLVLLGLVFSAGEDAVPRVLAVGGPVPVESVDPDLLEVEAASDLDAALLELEEGTADAAVVAEDGRVTVYYSQTSGITGDLAAARLGELFAVENVAAMTARGANPALEVETEAAEDESIEPVQYLAPGILAWGIAISGVFGAAGTLVDLKRDKLLRRLRVTPASAGRFISARITVNLLVAVIQAAVFLGAAASVLGLRLSAWTWFAIPLVLLGTFAFLAIGVVVGSIAKTSPGAAGLSNLVTMPMAFISGAFWQVEAMPGWMVQIAQFSPMTHLNLAVQRVVSLGEPPAAVLPHIAYLAGFAVVVTLIALKAFRFDEL